MRPKRREAPRGAILCVAVLLLCPAAQAAELRCAIQGDTMHWIADYCMYRIGTDDFANAEVGKCFRAETREHPDSCANRSRYKRRICEMMKAYFGGSVEKCMADETFSGPAVRNGGV